MLVYPHHHVGDTMGIVRPRPHPASVHDSAPSTGDDLAQQFTAESVRTLQTAHTATREMKKALNGAIITDTEIKTGKNTVKDTGKDTGKDTVEKGESTLDMASSLSSRKKSGEKLGNVLLERGSAAAIGAKARRMFLEAERFFR